MSIVAQHNALNEKKIALKYLLLAGQFWYILRPVYNIKKNLEKLNK
jgi:hypothetical protein